MADSMPGFRSALNGFNRNDVVQFIQAQTIEHEKALRILRDENARLQEALTAARAENDDLRTLNESLNERLQADETAAPEAPAPAAAPAAPAALDAPMMPAATVVKAAAPDFNEMELAAYRRAEMTERMARERANSSAERMKAIFSQADEKLAVTSQDFKTLLDAFQTNFGQMEQLLQTAQGIVDESSSSLKAAADICCEP
ncbi:MAG: hypothetical protein IJJ99_09000 [Oscillospiraceae bacterium]|nr:hypothetical protein [Oscillospiraceae bacterium]